MDGRPARRTNGRELEREVVAEIDAFHFGVAPQLPRSAGAEDFSFGDDVCAVGDAQCFADVVVCNQYADAAGLEVENDLLQVEHSDGVDARKRLIQQDERG